MPESPLYQQSREYERFHCIGAACEDTCCSGWQVTVDQRTYDKYRESSHPVLRPQLEQWIQIQPAAKDSGSFARIVLMDASCPFLSENLCSIQAELGEDHLGKTCATFPRNHNNVAGVVERSLDLSCPEAARLCLTDPTPASFHQVTPGRDEHYSFAASAEPPHRYFWEIRSALLSLLQNRRFPVTKRSLLTGLICGKLDELAATGNHLSIPQLLEGFLVGIDAGLYHAHLAACSADAADQLTIVLELLAARIKLDFTPQRYLDQYQEFVHGLRLEPGLNVRQSGHRYAQAFADCYQPFITKHEHMLEHYLVHYAYRTLFPFGSKALNDSLDSEQQFGAFSRHYLLMASYFAIVRATMIGLAAHYGSDFGIEHAIRCIQSSSRTLEHCTSYPPLVLQTLSGKGIANSAGMSVLTQDPR